jgi:hypothetical protein
MVRPLSQAWLGRAESDILVRSDDTKRGASTVANSLAVRRLCLAAGIDGYYQNDNRAQTDLRRRLEDALERTLTSAGVTLDRTVRQDRDDGQLFLLPVGVKAETVVPALIRGLLERLDDDRSRAPLTPLRLRVSVVPGIVTRAQDGYAGRPVALATLLADSQAVRDALEAQRTALLALIISDDLHRDVFKAGRDGADAAGFRRVAVGLPDGEWQEDAWVRAMEAGAPQPARNRVVSGLRNTVMPALGVAPGAVADVLDNPEVDTELGNAAHDADDSHGEWVTYTESTDESHAAYVAEENGYLAGEEYDTHADYTTVDYESFDSPPDSHDELY